MISLIMLSLLAACAGRPQLPELAAVNGTQAGPNRQRCDKAFLSGNWQLVHAIDFNRSGRGGTSLIGVTTLTGPTLHCLLMTVEGLVLFEAELAREQLTIQRAIPPFDKPEFAGGLMGDVQTIFVQPAGQQPLTGRLAGGDVVCRYHPDNDTDHGQITDIIVTGDDGFRIHVYGPDRRRTRTIVAGARISKAAGMVPETLELTASGLSSYTLTMTLISADKL
ncbi:MAG: hypothetical protein K0A99_05045 [Desulfoarculaceae bacterium]|nr:hypothetical protein [Desulfoarculaceae bacterium]